VPSKPDRRLLSDRLACEIAGLEPPKRRAWAKKGLLKPSSAKDGMTERETIELAVVRELHDFLAPRDAAVAWAQIEDALPEHLLSPYLDLVFDVGYREAILAARPPELPEAVRTTRVIRVIPLATLIQRVRESFLRMTAEHHEEGKEGALDEAGEV
jgi:hypothetical protein